MTLRCPPPLNEEEWARFVENLKRGPTPKQKEMMEEAERVWGKRIKEMDAARDC